MRVWERGERVNISWQNQFSHIMTQGKGLTSIITGHKGNIGREEVLGNRVKGRGRKVGNNCV